MDKADKDRLFSQPLPQVVDFKFDESVAQVFPDIIRRSVPGYETIIELTGTIAEKYAQPDSNIYDLGYVHVVDVPQDKSPIYSVYWSR